MEVSRAARAEAKRKKNSISWPPSKRQTALPIERILVVDDDRMFVETLVRAFLRKGKDARGVTDPREALILAREWRPQLALLDLMMPWMHGTELAHELREFDPNITNVILTGAGSEIDAFEAGRSGDIYLWIQKASVGSAELVALADGATAASRAEPAPRSHVTADEAEWNHTRLALHAAGGNISEAARNLGIHRQALQKKLRKRKGHL